MTDFNFVRAEDYIQTLEAWPIAGTMELDYLLVSRIHRFIMDPLMAMRFKIRAFNKFHQVMDKPELTCYEDIQVYMNRVNNS